MNKLVVGFAVCALGFSAYAVAGCEDGQSMAEEAVLKVVAKEVKNAKKVCTFEAGKPMAADNGEDYIVSVTCHGKPKPSYSVSLKEEEDATCEVVPGSVSPFKAQ